MKGGYDCLRVLNVYAPEMRLQVEGIMSCGTSLDQKKRTVMIINTQIPVNCTHMATYSPLPWHRMIALMLLTFFTKMQHQWSHNYSFQYLIVDQSWLVKIPTWVIWSMAPARVYIWKKHQENPLNWFSPVKGIMLDGAIKWDSAGDDSGWNYI